VFEVSEGIKRTTTSGGDAQQNGAIALYVMEHDLRNAGMGFNDVSYAGCKVLAYDSKRVDAGFHDDARARVDHSGRDGKGSRPVHGSLRVGRPGPPTRRCSVNMDSAGNGADPLSLTNPTLFARETWSCCWNRPVSRTALSWN